jgi:hypothetical protein
LGAGVGIDKGKLLTSDDAKAFAELPKHAEHKL